MPIENKVDAAVTPEDETLVIDSLKNVRTVMPFLVNIPPDERTRLARLSRGKVDFLDTVKVQLEARPDLAPSYLNIDEFNKDMALRDVLYRVRAELASLDEILDDTLVLLESEAYQQGRLFYKSVKAAAKEGAEDAERIADELGYHFKKQGSPKKDADSEKKESDTDSEVAESS
jgi:hypothetical protein